VPAERHSRVELDPHLDDLTSGDAEIVPLELGAPDARLLRRRQVQRQTAADERRHHARDSLRFHVDRKLRRITQPCLVVNGVLDNMIPVRNSYALGEHLPRAMLLTYPDAGHGSLFQFHESFVRQASLFLDSELL
jgi:pimeloyl-ACP methyl ester carboxylesterase